MDQCEVVAVPRGRRVEVRAAPPGEPLASCAFEWPAGWAADAPTWGPPGLLRTAPLFSLHAEGGLLTVEVARFGCEVDGLAFLRHITGDALPRGRFVGLSVVETPHAGGRLAVVHAGPALFILRGHGRAARHVLAAALSLRSLSGFGPNAEPLASLSVGAWRAQRLASWASAPGAKAAHGVQVHHLTLGSPTETPLARLRIEVTDRRIHVGQDPREVLDRADAAWVAAGIQPPRRAPDPGAGGPAEVGASRQGDAPVELRRALRRVGSALVLIEGLWRLDAPVARLNGRRHFDLLLALGAAGE